MGGDALAQVVIRDGLSDNDDAEESSVDVNDADDQLEEPGLDDNLPESTRLIFPVIAGSAIAFPDGLEITVAPMLVRTQVRGKSCQHLTAITWSSDMDGSGLRNVELEATLWSA